MKKLNKAALISVFACFAIVACGKKDTKKVDAGTPVPAKLEVLSAQCKNNLLELSYKKNNEICNATAEYVERALTKIKASFILSANGQPVNPGNPSTPSVPATPSTPSAPANPSNPSSPANPSNPSNPSVPDAVAGATAAPLSVIDKNLLLKVTLTLDKSGEIVGIDGEADGTKLTYNNVSDLKDVKIKAMHDKCVEMLAQLKLASKKCEAR